MPAPLPRPALINPSTAPDPASIGAARRPQRPLNLKPYNTFGIAATARAVYTLDELARVDEVLGAIRDEQDMRDEHGRWHPPAGTQAHAPETGASSRPPDAADSSHGARPPLILSGGSNLLLARDLSEPVLLVRTQGRQLVDQQGDTVLLDIAAGEVWHDIVRWTIAQGYGGLENLALIPGRVGAAPWQNIGAYGVEVGDCIESVAAIHLLTGERRCFPAAECAFGYRQSFFKTPEGRQWLIVSVRLRLSTRFEPRLGYAELASALPSGGLTAAQVADTVETIRRRKLPDPAVLGNAGSFFHNPVVSAEVVERLRHQYPGMPAHPTTPDNKRAVPHNTAPAIASAAPDAGASTSSGSGNSTPTAPSTPVHTGDTAFKLSAGWLIDQCGWKGYREGDAGVSPNHALVLVNHGNATGQQMLALANRIQQSVFERFGVNLHPEPVIIR